MPWRITPRITAELQWWPLLALSKHRVLFSRINLADSVHDIMLLQVVVGGQRHRWAVHCMHRPYNFRWACPTREYGRSQFNVANWHSMQLRLAVPCCDMAVLTQSHASHHSPLYRLLVYLTGITTRRTSVQRSDQMRL